MGGPLGGIVLPAAEEGLAATRRGRAARRLDPNHTAGTSEIAEQSAATPIGWMRLPHWRPPFPGCVSAMHCIFSSRKVRGRSAAQHQYCAFRRRHRSIPVGGRTIPPVLQFACKCKGNRRGLRGAGHRDPLADPILGRGFFHSASSDKPELKRRPAVSAQAELRALGYPEPNRP